LEDERRRRAAAEEAVRRTERERDQLRDAIYQLQVCVATSAPLLMAQPVYQNVALVRVQEAMKSLDTSGQINELVKQVSGEVYICGHLR
jgi:hypothetical protein